MKIEYSSNNSGGSWWLKDRDWKALEEAGWTVKWEDKAWMGALATSAEKDFASISDAIREFEKVTGANASDEGCNCCGPPHSFSWRDKDDKYGWCSGEDCLTYLYDDVPEDLREACERLNRN